MKITFLGTGNAQATACYNTCFVMEEGGKCLLVDGGGGNLLLRRLQDTGYKWQDMRDIIVTHMLSTTSSLPSTAVMISSSRLPSVSSAES